MTWILIAFLHGNPVELSTHTSQVSCMSSLRWQEKARDWDQIVCVRKP